MSKWRISLILIALNLAAASCTTPFNSSEKVLPPGQAEVVRVVDGDTVILRLGSIEEHVRLIGIDTPETLKPNNPVECYGPEASDHLKHLLPAGTRVRAARDAEARDHYGRLLLYIWRTDDNLFINLDIAIGGFGRPLAIAPNNAHRSDFAAAAAAASTAKRGLWGTCGAN